MLAAAHGYGQLDQDNLMILTLALQFFDNYRFG